MPHTFGSTSVHHVIISRIDSKQVAHSPCEHYRKKEHVILLLFVWFFFPSHIGHHLLFIRNTTLTVKSHISKTQRRDNKLSGSAGEGRAVLGPLWRGPRTEVMSSGLWCLRELMFPFSEGSSGIPVHQKFHSTLALIVAFVCLLNCLFLHSVIQQHAANHCIFFPELTEARICNVKIQ